MGQEIAAAVALEQEELEVAGAEQAMVLAIRAVAEQVVQQVALGRQIVVE